MPMYDYHCKKCDNIFEELVFSWTVPDEDITCPECQANESERLLAAPMVSTGGSSSSHAGGGCSSSSGFS
ncbi:MAG: zinc ribbon domain-containing protein [Candidatus Neomarinimicrobiota bacterium]